MAKPIRLAFALHNHQPIGNFGHVFEQAYQDSYRPFLEMFGRYESLKMSLHTSGSLMEWIDARHPDYVDHLAALAAEGRLEIIGGAYYEPILAMIPSRDRVGQIREYTRWLENRLGAIVRGMWIPERVWEQSFVRDLSAAGIEYCILDDFHFKNAGLVDSQLHGHYLTEDDGRVMSIFPGSERLRYLIPFGDPHQTIEYLAGIAEEHEDPIVVFGDDGEKFGTWPETKKHVYTDGWLGRFFDALVENQDWIRMTTLAEANDGAHPIGKVYLPDSSYREMTEWAMPAERQVEYDRVSHEMQDDHRWEALKQFVRGGFWRNFKIRYGESDEMYSRMMSVSRRLNEAIESHGANDLIDRAQTELYRGQCNCGYWHGAFGGIYLPHLRNAIYEHLIAADNLLDEAQGLPDTWIEAKAEDFNFDGRQEVQLANDKLVGLIAPFGGGHLYELDVRSIRHNLLATLRRRPEAYHRKVLGGASNDTDDCASIHDRVVFKQEGLEKMIQYDDHPRKSLVDLFYDEGTSFDAVVSGKAVQRGDFVEGVYETRLRRNPGRIQVQLSRQGNACGFPVRVSKAVTLNAGSSTLEIAYLLEDLPPGHPIHFGVEFNFAGMPAEADNRYFYDAGRNQLGQLGSTLDLSEVPGVGLVDEWLGIDVGLKASRATNIWAYPVATVSQSEGGFELVHQSVVVQPHWLVEADADGRWTVTMHLSVGAFRVQTNPIEAPAVAATT